MPKKGPKMDIENKIIHSDCADKIKDIETEAVDLVYLDPPYYGKGRDLYANYYTPEDHAALADFLRTEASFNWVLSYDDLPEGRELYRGLRQANARVPYCAHSRKLGQELLICSDDLELPESWESVRAA